jgi:DNA polymerase-3 subunit delta
MPEVHHPRDAALGSLLLFLGPEEFLFRKALVSLRAAMTAHDPEADVHRLDASQYTAGQLDAATQSSLFSSSALVEVENAGSMSEAFLNDALAYCKAPVDEVVVVIHHSGGTRGKKLLDQLKKAAAVYDCSTLKKDADKVAYVAAEFRAGQRRIQSDAAQALVAAVGSSMAELDSACRQLMDDVTGAVDVAVVNRYYGGRVEATAFKVADAAVGGQTAQALGIARAAMSTGVDPVPLIASIGMKVRQIAKVSGFHGTQGEAASQFGMAPWMAKNAMNDARRWSKASLVRAVDAVAEADYNVKGGSRNPGFAVERLIIELGRLASRR